MYVSAFLLFVALAAATTCPQLNVVSKLSFTNTYSCPFGKFNYNYTGCTIFLSDADVKSNLPALLYDGYSCSPNSDPLPSYNTFSSQNQPEYASFVADLGTGVDISTATFRQFWKNADIKANAIALVQKGHTYAVWATNPGSYTANFFVTVTYHEPSRRTDILLKVTDYRSDSCK